jgi:CTP:molybdopterin cytidylyltransferase MocA
VRVKIVAAIFADFEESFLGGPSALARRLGERTVVAHTLNRLLHVEALDGRCIFVRPRDEAKAREAVAAVPGGDRVDVLPLDDGMRARRGLLRSARKWGLSSWRGTPLGTTWFDEFLEPLAAARVLDHYGAEGVLCLDGCQPLLDPALATRMIAHARENAGELDFVFTQAPPGIAGVLLRRQTTRELLENQWPFGLLLAYRPEAPRGDLITRAMCCPAPPEVAQTSARLTADTRRSRETVESAIAALGERAGAQQICAWLAARARSETFPLEIEIELTTDDPLPHTSLRLRGQRVPSRRIADLEAVKGVAAQIAGYDDTAIVLGGHGDPLLHPQFPEICQRIRAAGVAGLGVTTALLDVSDAAFEALFEHGVDLLEVRLDAASGETFQSVHKRDAFDAVQANIERIDIERKRRLSPQPIVVPSLTRCAATLGEMERFFDNWIRRTGWAVLRGYNDYSGRLPPDSLLPTEPLIRRPCARLDKRLLLLADGTVARCEQDVRGEYPLGAWTEQSIEEIWAGTALHTLRAEHTASSGVRLPLCQTCHEWHRP